MIYIHIPYCRSFCTYCDFYSVIPTDGVEAFVNALCGEIVARREEIPWVCDTLYIGGGTPSVLPLTALRRVVETIWRVRSEGSDGSSDGSAVLREGEIPHFDEFTVEVNPDDIVRLGVEYVRGLGSLGVNRISMGVQSLDDGVLKWMNRRHSAASAREAYRLIREGGIDNISVDLIFGISDNTEILEKNIEGFFGFSGDGVPPRHISAYQLSIERGSELAEMVERGAYVPASDEVCARQYEIICERLGAVGYHHYEISNFAQPGFEAKHNSAYWRHIPYIGFGPAAHSFFIREDSSRGTNFDSDGEKKSVVLGKYFRRWNKPDICAYLKAAETGDWNSVSEGEVLTPEQIREEKIMLALRTDIGIPAYELPDAEKMVEKGLLEMVAHPNSANDKDGSACGETITYLRIPESKFFVSDDIIAELI